MNPRTRATVELGSARTIAGRRASVLAVFLLGAVGFAACNGNTGLGYKPGPTDAAGPSGGRPDVNALTETGLSEQDAAATSPPAATGAGGTFGAAGDAAVGPVNAGTVGLDKAFLDFGTVGVGVTSSPQTVTVTVAGAAAAIEARVTGTGFAIFANTCAAVQPIGTCVIGVKFTPTAVGGASGVLTLGGASLALSGIGIGSPGGGVGTFSATDRVDLGTLLVGATAPVLVQIIPSTAAGVTGLTCIASGADLILASQTCPAMGAIATSCTFDFTFKATAPGTKSDAVICSGGGRTTQTVVIATVVTPAETAISPLSQTFTARVGESVTWTFNVTNSGGSPTGTLTAAISAGASDFSIASNDCLVPLASLSVCKIQVTFAPSAVGAKNGTLTVADATPGSTPATATLAGNGIESAPSAIIAPASTDFGTVQIPLVKTTAFTLTNNSGSATGTLTLTSSDPEFTIGNDLCTGRPLAAKSQCIFDVTFAPEPPMGLKKATVNASQTSDGAILASATVSGTVQAEGPAPLWTSPPYLDFGTTSVGVPVGPKIFTITNTGNTASGALAVIRGDSTSSVGGASQFTYTTTCTAALAPNGTCQVVVTYAPTIEGSASAVFTVSDGTVSAPNRTTTGIALAPAARDAGSDDVGVPEAPGDLPSDLASNCLLFHGSSPTGESQGHPSQSGSTGAFCVATMMRSGQGTPGRRSEFSIPPRSPFPLCPLLRRDKP